MAQLIGGFLACVTSTAITGETIVAVPPKGVWIGLFVEILYTFVLVSVILNMTQAEANKDLHVFGLVIGFTIAMAAMTIGPISGCILNPAVGTGLAMNRAIFAPNHNDRGWDSFWIYWVAPLLGSTLAFLYYTLTIKKHKDYTLMANNDWGVKEQDWELSGN